ncbi:MAG: C-type lectin domain protein, partial [Pedosphaera sp.]|nr:C-type lectin domain protein [Pedosphaera sp.]
MKNRFTHCHPQRNRFLLALLLAFLSCLPAATSRAQGSAGSFVEPVQHFISVGLAADTTALGGNTYVLGSDGGTTAILRKYDKSGAQLTWGTTTNLDLSISSLVPTALCVGLGGTNVYVVGGTKIYRLDSITGSTLGSLNVGNNAVGLKSVYCSSGSLYVCGQYTSSSDTVVLGSTATHRGSKAGIIIKLDANLPGGAQAQALVTFGNTGGSAINTANSVVVDDSGDVYVGGHLDTGAFASGGFAGSFSINTKHSSTSLTSLALAQAANAYDYFSSSTVNSPAINISTSGDYNYVIRATGLIDVTTPGNYTFQNYTDDGSWLYVDGQKVIYDDSNHGATGFNGSIALSTGLHSVDFLQYNGGGPGVAGFYYTPPGGAFVPVPAANFVFREREAYVFKFDANLGTLKQYYFSTTHNLSSTQGGEYYQLHYAQGWIYAVGFWQGTADNSDIGATDVSNSNSKDAEIVKLDTGLHLKSRATVKGATDNAGFSISSDDNGNVY